MASIRDIPNTIWRNELLPASFKGAAFHVEAGGKESGRRIVTHEFPKRELPYSEDLGRKAIQFTVRGYCIAYPINTATTLYQRDYRVPRNSLIDALQRKGAGSLQLPTLAPMMVVCSRYRWTEEERFGGYCVFDMTFNELGIPPDRPGVNSEEALIQASKALRDRVVAVLDGAAAGRLQAARLQGMQAIRQRAGG